MNGIRYCRLLHHLTLLYRESLSSLPRAIKADYDSPLQATLLCELKTRGRRNCARITLALFLANWASVLSPGINVTVALNGREGRGEKGKTGREERKIKG